MQRNPRLMELADRLSRGLADQGKLIEAGWIGYQLGVLPSDAPPLQVSECKLAFFAGAMHLFSSLMTIMDSEAEPTEADLVKMDLIQKEFEAFSTVLESRIASITKTKGSA